MGPRHSKRTLEIAVTPTKSEIEGVGEAGKLEKFVDGIVEKVVAANGHVDGELQQNGCEHHQNGLEPVQNGEVAAVAEDHTLEPIKLEEKENENENPEPVVALTNGEMEEKVNGEAEEKAAPEEKAAVVKHSKKERKKEKKDKVVKKKFSFRSFSFSKKDKSKPKAPKGAAAAAAAPVVADEMKDGIEETKEPETVPEPEAVTNCQVEETNDVVPTSEVTEVKEVTEVASPETPNEPVVEEQTPQVTAVEEQTPQMTVVEEQKPQVTVVVSDAKVVVMGAGIPTVKGVDIIKPVQKELTKEELPPPLPASPPPTEPKEELVAKDRESEQVADEAMTPVKEALTTEKCAPEVQKTVELTESVRNAVEEAASCDQSNEDVGATDTSSSEETIEVKAEVSAVVLEQSSHSETVANVVTLSSNAEETSEKEEFGAGESLAEMDSATETVIAASNEVIVAE